MNSNPKFKPMEHSAHGESVAEGLEGHEIPGIEDLPVDLPLDMHGVHVDEHTKEHVLGDIQETPPKVKRGKPNMFPDANSGRDGFKSFFAKLKSNPLKLVKYSAFAVLATGVGFLGYQLRSTQNRLARAEKNSATLYAVIKEMKINSVAGNNQPVVDYTGAINELAGRLAAVEQKADALAQASARPATAPAKSKTVAKNSKAAGRSLASTKKSKKKPH